MVLAILNALAAIPSIVGFIESFAAQVTLWLIQRQNNENLSAIADAASASASAKTQEERYAATEKWMVALSRPKLSSE